MKKIIVIIIFLFLQIVSGQESPDMQLKKINRQIDSIVQLKSRMFDQFLDSLKTAYHNGEISKNNRDFLLKQTAKQYADDLDYSIFKLTGDLKRVAKGQQQVDSTQNRDLNFDLHRIRMHRKRYYDKKIHKNKNTFAYMIIAAGANNVIENDKINSIENSPYGYWQSRFLELGIDWKAHILHHRLFAKYGFSFVWNTLKPLENQYHEIVNDTLQIVTLPYELSRSKLRNIWLKIPLSAEINLPDNKRGHFRLSAGVYGKIRCATKQKLTYSDGSEVEKTIKYRYNVRNFIYGISAEAGGTTWSIYANYDLKSLFENRNWKMLSIGVKIEM
jgi:hypothetical protein